MAKHFFKILTIFLVMIILGLIGIFAVDYWGKGIGITTSVNNQEVAK